MRQIRPAVLPMELFQTDGRRSCRERIRESDASIKSSRSIHDLKLSKVGSTISFARSNCTWSVSAAAELAGTRSIADGSAGIRSSRVSDYGKTPGNGDNRDGHMTATLKKCAASIPAISF